ncbi:MAG: CHAT domain-containing protein [Chloroflexota bacterium]
MSIKYLDFDLLIERGGVGYTARVLESPAGEASAKFDVPFSQTDVEDFFIQIGHTRSFEPPQVRKMHEFGQALFEAVFRGEVRDRLRASLSEAGQQGAGLRIRLRLSGVPELGNLPWEFIYDPSLNRFLALSVETPLVRYLETSQAIQPLTVQPPLRILTMICGPKDFPKLDVEREWENLRESVQSLQAGGLVHLHRLTPPTLPALQQQLRREQYHIFHFVGHGVFSKRDQDGFLLLENEQGGGHRLSARDLGTLLHDHRPLRLVVLNACEGARAALDDQFAGTAQSLIQQGIPAVIAMQFRITDQASITLAHEFYGALADGYPVDAALTEARKAIKTQGNELEWGTPVLYMRSPDGRIFDVAQLPAAAPRPVPLADPQEAARQERLYTEALEAFYLGKWAEAYQKFQAIVDANPGHKDAAAKLEIARQKMRLQTFNEQALAAEKEGDWDKAISSLEKLLAADPNYPEAAARLARARRQNQLTDLYAEAKRLAQAEKWQAVLEIFREIDSVNPRNPDPQGLRTLAERNLSKAKKTKELETAYAGALTALDSGNWQEAVRLLRRVRGLQAGYRESESLLRRAESELEHARKPVSKTKAEAPAKEPARFEWLLLGLVLVFIGARILAQWLGGFIHSTWLEDNSNAVLVTSVYMLPAGIATGLVLWWFLSKAIGPLLRKEIILIVATSALAETIFVDLGISLYPDQLWAWTLTWAVIRMVVAIPIALVLRRAIPAFNKNQIAAVLIGWGLGYAIGVIAGNNLRGNLIDQFGQELGFSISVYIEQFFGSLIGGWVTLRQTKIRFGEIKTPEGIVLATAAGFALCHLATQALVGGMNYKWISEHSNFYIAEAIFKLCFGALIGVAFLWLLVKLEARLSHSQIPWFILAQALLVAILMAAARLWSQRLAESWVIMWAVYGLLSGFAVASILRRNDPSFTKGRFPLIVVGWMIAFPIGEIFHWSLVDAVQESIKDTQIANIIIYPIRTGISGLIGGLFMVGALNSNQGFRLNWKTILAGFLGFGLGNLLTNIVTAPMEESTFASVLQFLIWGLIGGASLAVPSTNYKHYLTMGLLGGFGMMIGNLISIAFGDPDGINKIIIGMTLGLVIGIRTKRVTAAFVLALAATTGCLIRTSLLTGYYYPSNLSMAAPVEFTFLALTAGLMGAIIGLAWSFLNSAESSTSTQGTAK